MISPWFSHGEELNIVPMDLREFAYDVKDTLLAEFLQRHIVLIVKLDESYPTFYGDPIRLKQACINLLKNAMESITGRGKIILKIFVQEKKLLIAVKDNGCGMTSEQLTNVFHPFVTTKEHGTGLGLPIVRKIVTAHGGTVRVSSTPGKGSEFQMYLPAAAGCFCLSVIYPKGSCFVHTGVMYSSLLLSLFALYSFSRNIWRFSPGQGSYRSPFSFSPNSSSTVSG